MNDDFNLVTVIDDDGNEHAFEELDRIETDDGNKYIALIPAEEDESDEGELIILKVLEEDGNSVLEAIEDENEFEDIAEAFRERLSEMFDFEE